MQQWFLDHFVHFSAGWVIVNSSVNTTEVFDTSDPQGFFGGISVPPSYADLSLLPCASEGWQRIFDAWKAQGIIS